MIGDIMGGLVAEHVVSRSVRDTAAVLDATAGPEIGDPGSYLEATKGEPKRLHIAFTTKVVSGELDPECKAASEAAAKLCEKLGHYVEEDRPQLPADDEANFRTNFITIWATGLAMVVEFFGKTLGKTPAREDFEGLTWAFYQLGKTITAAQYLRS